MVRHKKCTTRSPLFAVATRSPLFAVEFSLDFQSDERVTCPVQKMSSNFWVIAQKVTVIVSWKWRLYAKVWISKFWYCGFVKKPVHIRQNAQKFTRLISFAVSPSRWSSLEWRDVGLIQTEVNLCVAEWLCIKKKRRVLFCSILFDLVLFGKTLKLVVFFFSKLKICSNR